MLPASVAAAVATLAALFAGKTPVMLNWTTGPRGVLHALDLLDIRCVVTARRLVSRLESEGFCQHAGFSRAARLPGGLSPSNSRCRQVARGLACAPGAGRPLEEARALKWPPCFLPAARRACPKAVPLTQANLLANIRDALAVISLRRTRPCSASCPRFIHSG